MKYSIRHAFLALSVACLLASGLFYYADKMQPAIAQLVFSILAMSVFLANKPEKKP